MQKKKKNTGVNGEIKNTQSQLRDVEKLLKLDPGNTELLAQKHKLLGQAVEETKEKLTTLKTAAEQANTVLANGEISQKQYDALQREIIETENDLKKLEEQATRTAILSPAESFAESVVPSSNAGFKMLHDVSSGGCRRAGICYYGEQAGQTAGGENHGV